MKIKAKVFGIGTVLTEYEVKSRSLPKEFDGFRILHISDFHCVPKRGMLNCIEGVEADAVMITGDMADEDRPYELCAELLKKLLKIAPVYQIAGNHDMYKKSFGKFRDKCSELGAHFLCNETAVIKRSGAEIYIHGIDDPKSIKRSEIDEGIKKSLARLERREGFEILLFHRANKLDLFKNEGFNLILSGHMHGGQLRLPHFGGVLSPKSGLLDTGSLLFPKYSGGRYRIGEAVAIVNRGLGNSVPLPRWGNPTEIVSIVLKRDE